MVRTLADQMSTDIYSVLLNTDDGAETITFYPASDGVAREIVALVTPKTEVQDNDVAAYEDEVVTVVVGNDEDHAKGGIAIPAYDGNKAINNDAFKRATDDYEDPRFVFTGESEQMTGGWKLTFSRPKSNLYGRPRRHA